MRVDFQVCILLSEASNFCPFSSLPSLLLLGSLPYFHPQVHPSLSPPWSALWPLEFVFLQPAAGLLLPLAKSALSLANLPVPVCFFPCYQLVPSSSSLGKEMTNCHFLKHPLLHQLLLKRQRDKWISAFERLNSSRKYSTHKWGASKSIPSS